MRKRLLFLCFTLSLCAYAFALDDGNYLVRNVATGKYWGAGNSWGTHASLVDNPEYVTWVKLEDGKYHLESQVNNGDSAFYFDGDYMDTDSPIALTIEQRTNGYYTIGNGEIYYGYDGSSTVLGKTETDPTAANVQWEIISVEDATKALSAATQTAPMNATFLIADPNFGRNNRHYGRWTFEASNKNNEGDVTNYCVESWHATFTMSQTINVPNGVYGLTAQGFYSQDGDDDEHLPVFFINEATRTFPIRTGNENTMTTVSASFSQGCYIVDPVFVNVTNGIITLGARLEENTGLWCIWDNFTLMYYGTEANAKQMNFEARFNRKMAEVNDLLNTDNVSTEGLRLLNEAENAFTGIDANSTESEQQTVEDQIDAAIDYVREGLILVEQLTTYYNKYGEKVGTAGSENQELTALLTNITSAIFGKFYESNSQIENWIAELTTARKQYLPYEYRYWFDNDETTGMTDQSATAEWSFNADISGLRETLHTLHLQVSDKDGVLSSPITRFFVKTIDNNAVQGRYWFDDAIDQMKVSPQMEGTFDIDVSHLSEGFHTIHYQVVGTNGNTSAINSHHFYKVYMPRLGNWRCWFDNDPSTMTKGTNLNKTILLDVSNLVDGYHLLHIVADGGADAVSTTVTKPFIKIPQVDGVEYLTCLCMIDNKIHKQEQVSAKGGVMEWQFDVSSLPQGFHRLFIQVVTPSGAATSAYQSFFMRETTNAEFAQMKCVYAIDGAEFYTEAGQLAEGTFHFDLDVSMLEDGLHRISYMLSNGLGVNTKAQSQFFVKTPLGGNGIMEYWYWLNDQADVNATKVKLSEKQDPFSLITLLPVESQPLRSSLFQFRVENGQPVIYSKNDFHIRFYDAAGRFTDVSKQFVDESVKQEVADVTLLTSGVRATTAKPAENIIKWYCLEAEPGDSLQFKLDRAATIQLFAPSGEEVHAASGSEVVKWNGLHVRESGTYYLALHDVTAQQGITVSIDYEHIDKYAVLRQDVAVVGNRGFSTITFEGNGFDELTSVCLMMGAETIQAVIIGHEDNAKTSVKFNFDDVPLGKYKAVFTFSDDEITVEKCITVEEAVSTYFDVAADFNKSYLVASRKTKYIFSVHNNGNLTAYNVPLMIRVYTHNAESLDRIDVEGYDMEKDYRQLFGDNYTDSMAVAIKEKKAVSGDRCFFLEADSTDIVSGWAAHVHQGFVFPDIPPYSTKEIAVSLELGQSVFCYMWCPEDWDNEAANARDTKRASKKKCTKDIFAHESHCAQNSMLVQAGETPLYNEDCTDYKPFPMGCDGHGGNSNPVNSFDPNEIYGYMAESGSKAVKDEQTEVYYTVQFENEPEFATAAAHEIIVADTLDAQKFDFSTFVPTRIKIGEKSSELTGDKNFVTTVDMRPEINAIAQVEGTFDKQKGIVKWHIISLDPMTMEPTDDPMDGVLPVNANGNGIGEVSYNISLKPGLMHGTEVKNRAGIVFDNNETIMTPYWTNVIDRIAPESHVADVQMATDSTAAVRIAATDELSGPWRYNVYVQYGSGAWFLGAENVPIDSVACVKVYEGIDHGFYTLVTDSAGNVEQKAAAREFTFEVFGSQVDTNTQIELAQGWNWISHNQQEPLSVEALKPASARMLGQTEETINDTRFGWVGDLEELLPTQMYKIQTDEVKTVQLSGRLFNAGFRAVPLYEGWNWLGYPVANTMTPAEALQKLEAEEGDFLIGQDGMATYSEGQWTGTLTEMVPGLGYMYRSGSDKNLFYNATAQASSRRINAQFIMHNSQLPEGWTVNKRKYPNVMGVIAQLWHEDNMADSDEWLLGAFCGDECRGIAKVVDGALMMNVYGQGGEQIEFHAMNYETGELLIAVEQEPFRADVVGTMNSPYQMHIGEATGIASNNAGSISDSRYYDLQGRKVENGQMQKGLYIVTGSNRNNTQKVVRK